jgi:hypothetical protein
MAYNCIETCAPPPKNGLDVCHTPAVSTTARNVLHMWTASQASDIKYTSRRVQQSLVIRRLPSEAIGLVHVRLSAGG